MRTLDSLKRPLVSVVDKAMTQFSVPGVAVGIVRGDEELKAARGVTCELWRA